MGINKHTNKKYMWNKIKILKNTNNRVNWNSWAKGDREKAVQEEVERIAPPWTENRQIIITQQQEDDEYNLNGDFIMEEMMRAIKKSSKNSAPGPDHIEYNMIRRLPKEYLMEILIIFNYLYKEGKIIESWRKQTIIFIDKPGKNKVRPISLASCMGKILERMVNERLIWWAEKNKKFHPSQNGFRKGRSCLNNLTQLTAVIKTGYYKYEYTMAAMLDVAAAYDSVNCDLLVRKLISMKCSNRITTLIQEWFHFREGDFVVSDGEDNSIRRRVWKGLPQGAVLSPTLYALHTEDIMNNIEEGVELQFADDIVIFTRGKNTDMLKTKIIKSIERIKDNLNCKGLDLQREKTETIIFSETRKDFTNETYSIGNISKKIESTVKFLGVWLDTELNFRKHVETIRVAKANRLMRFMMGVKWGVECDTTLMLYKNLVRSTIEYGIFLYYPWESKTRLSLERAPFAGLRIALGYRKSTPTNVMTAEAKVLTLEDRAGMLARRFIGRIIAYGEMKTKRTIEELVKLEEKYRYGFRKRNRSIITEAWQAVGKFSNIIRSENNYVALQTDYWTVTNAILTDKTIGKKRKKGKINDTKMIEAMRKKMKLAGETELWFTDGSKVKENGVSKVGVGIYKDKDEDGVCCALDGNASIFTAELVAINIAMMAILEDLKKDGPGKNYIIATDSESSVTALESNRIEAHSNPYVCDIKTKVDRFNREKKDKTRQVAIIWVPAHIGVSGNEIADWLAKEGTQEIVREEYKVPVDDLKYYYKEEMTTRTKTKIRAESKYKGKFYFENFHDSNEIYPWFKEIRSDRFFMTTINRLRANHYIGRVSE